MIGTTLNDKIIELLKNNDGFTDREITDRILGHGRPQQSINIACREMNSKGIIRRIVRGDGLIGNYCISGNNVAQKVKRVTLSENTENMSEDEMKETINNLLVSGGWKTQVAWGRIHGTDIDAKRGEERWIIEVKGSGSSNEMRANYFLSVLGETLQNMDDPDAKYSIAFPDMKQYRTLWEKLPSLSKERTGISILFVNGDNQIEEVF